MISTRVELEGDFKVDRVLDMRLGRTGPEFLVRWVDYTHFGNQAGAAIGAKQRHRLGLAGLGKRCQARQAVHRRCERRQARQRLPAAEV